LVNPFIICRGDVQTKFFYGPHCNGRFIRRRFRPGKTSKRPLPGNPYRSTGENHIRIIKIITRGGQNAEAYLSFGQDKLIYQSDAEKLGCDQITFKGFPIFARDNKRLMFASNRFSGKPGETNIFIGDWVE
jgi:hypothetical protein